MFRKSWSRLQREKVFQSLSKICHVSPSTVSQMDVRSRFEILSPGVVNTEMILEDSFAICKREVGTIVVRSKF